MDYVSEFHREVNENDEKYVERTTEQVIKHNIQWVESAKYNEKKLNSKFQAVLFTELSNYKFKKDY